MDLTKYGRWQDGIDCGDEILRKIAKDVLRTMRKRGWAGVHQRQSGKSTSRYVYGVLGYRTACVRIADHPTPKRCQHVNISIHPGGQTKQDLLSFLDGL